MLTALALYLLACVDGALVGYRLAAGRSALVDKRAYFIRALLRGIVIVQPAIALAAFVAILLLLVAADAGRLTQELLSMGQRMLEVYVPYAGIVLASLALRAAPSIDLRVALSVALLGPATALRPFVMVAGVAWAALASLRPETVLMATLLATLMLIVEPVHDMRWPQI